MEEGLLLDGIALHPADVSPGNVKLPALVESHFAHSRLAFEYGAAVPAREAANAIPLDGLVEFTFADVLIQDFTQRGHRGELLDSILSRGTGGSPVQHERSESPRPDFTRSAQASRLCHVGWN